MANSEATSTVRNYDADWSWDEARLHFKTADPPFHHVLQRLNNPKEVDIKPVFESLARAIVGQQLSTKAAHTIWSRFSALYPEGMQPEVVLHASAEVHRGVGISGQKHRYITDLSRHYLEDPEAFDAVEGYSDADIISSWTKVKGLGQWTVQMHLMFQLQRPDVFPVDDLGVRRAMELALDIAKDSPKSVYEKRALVWSPFRTAASRFLWESLN